MAASYWKAVEWGQSEGAGDSHRNVGHEWGQQGYENSCVSAGPKLPAKEANGPGIPCYASHLIRGRGVSMGCVCVCVLFCLKGNTETLYVKA